MRLTHPALIPWANYIETLVEPDRSLFLHELKLLLRGIDERIPGLEPPHLQRVRVRAR